MKIPNEKNQNLDEIIKEPHIVLQNAMPMTELIETRDAILANLSAKSVLFKWNLPFVEMHTFTVVTLMGGDAYSISFTGRGENYELNLPVAKKMINSFEFVSNSFNEEQVQFSEIPAWIKSNAKFWADGLISDSEFLSGIKYLIK